MIVEAKNRLDKLNTYLQEQADLASGKAHDGHFEAASDKLSITIGHAERELALASAEWVSLPSNVASFDEPAEDEYHATAEVVGLARKLHQQVAELQTVKESYDLDFTTAELDAERQALNLKEEEVARKAAIQHEFGNSFKQLFELKKQRQPLIGVDDELTYFLTQVKRFKKDKSISTPELTLAMNAAYDVLTGGSQARFDEVTKALHETSSIPLKILGGALLALGFALVASGIFFAPAVIMSTASLSTIYAATLATAAVSSALTVGGAACFFKSTPTMQLADTMKPMSHTELENESYEKVGMTLS